MLLVWLMQSNAALRSKIVELADWGWRGGPAPTVTFDQPTALPALPEAPKFAVDTGTITKATETLNGLQVKARVKDAAYDRSCSPGHACSFGPAWTDDQTAPDGHNGCGTRDDVLRKQLDGPALKAGSRCVVVSGTLLADPYTGARVEFTKAAADVVQIDHVYPLALAFDMGASGWSLDKRQAFANDTALNLLAVSGPVNNFKSDKTASEWLSAVQPAGKSTQLTMTDPGRRCAFAAKYVGVAAAYGLPVTPSDKTALAAAFAACR